MVSLLVWREYWCSDGGVGVVVVMWYGPSLVEEPFRLAQWYGGSVCYLEHDITTL